MFLREIRVNSYEVGGVLQVPWWRQAVEGKQLKVTVEVILVSARVRQQQEPGRPGESKGGSDGGITDREW